jgi:hypothetical protein
MECNKYVYAYICTNGNTPNFQTAMYIKYTTDNVDYPAQFCITSVIVFKMAWGKVYALGADYRLTVKLQSQ